MDGEVEGEVKFFCLVGRREKGGGRCSLSGPTKLHPSLSGRIHLLHHFNE